MKPNVSNKINSLELTIKKFRPHKLRPSSHTAIAQLAKQWANDLDLLSDIMSRIHTVDCTDRIIHNGKAVTRTYRVIQDVFRGFFLVRLGLRTIFSNKNLTLPMWHVSYGQTRHSFFGLLRFGNDLTINHQTIHSKCKTSKNVYFECSPKPFLEINKQRPLFQLIRKLGGITTDEALERKIGQKKIIYLETPAKQLKASGTTVEKRRKEILKETLPADLELLKLFQILHAVLKRQITPLFNSLKKKRPTSYQIRVNQWFETRNLIKAFRKGGPHTFIASIGLMEEVLERFRKAGFTVTQAW